MPEPQPLGPNNVMFLFILLGFGVAMSITMYLLEAAVGSCTKLSRPLGFYMKSDQDKKASRDAKNKHFYIELLGIFGVGQRK